MSGLSHYLSSLLGVEALPQKGGFAIYAREFIPTSTLLAVWGGDIVPAERFFQLTLGQRRYAIQVAESLYQVSSRDPEPGDFINHSCDPNAGLEGPISLVAMRNIEPGEEICFDYAMSDGSPYDEFPCQCGAANCRGRVTGDDWKRPELQQRYAGYFSPYLQKRIEGQQALHQKNGLATSQLRVIAGPT